MDGAAKRPRQLKPHKRQGSSPHRRGRQQQPLFSEGSWVEVQTDEDDFKGVFFLATVIPFSTLSKKKSSKKNYKKLYVEYHNLLAHENGSECLREYVDASFVRPAPPPQEDVEGFELNDSVDAFYKDGWWTGVVTRVVEGGRFIVTFQYPPDELEFGPAELRTHWDWCNGSWIRPEKQSIAALMFDVGRKVEVSFDLEDSRDAWFPATIHEVLGNGAYFVKYCSSKIGNEAQFLKVTVDSLHVRPHPPLLKDKNFILLEKVDSFFNFGWWNGVITRVLEDCRYIVFFKQMKREKEFHQSELRPHMEWKDGKWFTTSSQDVSTPSSDNEKLSLHACENASGNTVAVPVGNLGDRKDSNWRTPCLLNLNENMIEPLIPTNEKSSESTKSLTKRKQHSSETRNALSQPLKKLKEGNVLGASQQVTADRSSKELLHSSPSSVSVNNMTSSAIHTATRDQSSDNPSWRKTILRKPQIVGENDFSTSRTLKKSRTPTLQLGSSEPVVGGKEPDTAGNAAENVQNEHEKKETEIPFVIGLPCAEMGSSEFVISRGKRGRRSNSKEIMKLVSDQKQKSNDLAIENMKNSKRSEIGEFSQTKKRGRPRKVLINTLHSLVTGNTENGDVASDEFSRKDGDSHRTLELVVIGTDGSLPNPELTFNGHNDESDPKNSNGRLKKRTSAKMHNEKVVKESIRLRKNPSSKRGRRWIKDSFDASGGTTMEFNCTADTVKKVVTEAPCNVFDDEPLSKWIEGMQTPSTVDDSQMSPVSTVEQCLENSEKQKDIVVLIDDSEKQKNSDVQPFAFEDKCAEVPSEQQSLPFVKNTILWKTIDSMEVFQRIPQRPHFQPLIHFKESSREGLAIGFMVTFSSAVEKVSRLQFNDPKSATDDILETLADLEKYGFDVRVVQDRVTELLAVKHKQEKLVEEVNGLNSQIVDRNLGKSKIDEEISEIKMQIVRLQEKLALAASAQEKEDSAIASLQSKLQKIEENIKIGECEFESLVSGEFESLVPASL